MSNTINKVIYDGNTLIDITDTTATSGDVMNGEVFYNADGTRGVGTLSVGNAKNYYGTSSTNASTQTKVVDCTGFVLETGATIDVKFTNKQNYNGTPKLNVNSTGAISITNGLKGIWASGDVVRFVYDGTSYNMVSMVFGGTATYGSVMLSTAIDSTATNYASTPSAVKQAYDLANGKQDAITSSNKLDISLVDKSIMTVYLKTDFTIANTNTVYDLTNVEVLESVGTKLTLSSGKIKIGAGVSKVKVSYTAKCLSPANSTRTFTYLMQDINGVATAITQEGAWFGGTNWQVNIGVTPRILSVNENDTFYLRCYGYKNNTIGGKSSDFIPTILTVEVVE